MGRRTAQTLVLTAALVLCSVAPAVADTTTTRPPNGDEIAASLTGGTGLVAAALIFGAGATALGLLLLQRWLHAAVDAS